MFQDHLKRLKPGRIRTIFCDGPAEVLAEIELTGLPQGDGRSLAVCRIGQLPGIDGLLSIMVEALADIALALFPNWYKGMPDLRDAHPLTVEEAVRSAALSRPGISDSWLRAAAALCLKERSPLPRRYSREIQAAQLSTAIGGDALCFLLAMEDPNPGSENLLGLTKAAEWFTRVTGSGVLLLFDDGLSDHPSLARLLYDAIHPARKTPPQKTSAPENEAKHTYQPVKGHPHPFSPGEQMLARRFSADGELSRLFRFNQTVETVRHHAFMVDLLWPEGRLVVEVDGYASHKSRFAFREDRRRDYELLISGYLVLRLTHEEIMEDPAMAVDKIRDLVDFRKGTLQAPLKQRKQR